MGYTLVVAEKPSVARDIARILGASQREEGYLYGKTHRVTWALGHLVTLKEPEELDPAYKKWRREDLPILPETLPLKVLPKTKKQYQVVKKLMLAKDTEEIICATDAGREGELIFRNIYQMTGCKKPVRRLWISSLTDEAIRAGFAKLAPSAQYDPLYQSARSRSEADWLVGMNASRAFTLRYGVLLSVGRVQTPTLSMLVKRRREIEAFQPELYFQVEADLEGMKGLYVLPGAQQPARLRKESQAQSVADAVRGKVGRIAEVAAEEKREVPPLLFDLTALQREANVRLGFTAQRTLKAAQSLYEKFKLITYPRTDSRYLSKDLASQVERTMAALQPPYASFAAPLLAAGLPRGKRIYDDSKVSDHHAILPTAKKAAVEKLPPDEGKLYDLVARRLVAVFSGPFRYEAQKVFTNVEAHRFLSTGRVELQAGWRAVEPPIAKGKQEEAGLPALTVGDSRKVSRVSLKKKKTEPPKPYTDATLLSAMEHAGREVEDEALREQLRQSGLGTPATRAAILERLVQVGFAERRGRQWNATDKGMRLIAAVPEEIASPETTGRWEKALSDITRGAGDPDRFLLGIRRMASYLVEFAFTKAGDIPFEKEEWRGKKRVPKVRAHTLPCPLCKTGQVSETAKAFGCTRWKEGCTFTLWKDALERSGGPKLTFPIVSKALANGDVQGRTGTVTYREGRVYFAKKKEGRVT